MRIIDLCNFKTEGYDINTFADVNGDIEYIDSLSFILYKSSCRIKVSSNTPEYYIYKSRKTTDTLIRIRNSLLLKKDIIFQNIANIRTTRTEDGGPYVRKEVIIAFNGGIFSIQKDQSPFKTVYDPEHPDAIKTGLIKGYIEYPNFNLTDEKSLLEETENHIRLIENILHEFDETIIIQNK